MPAGERCGSRPRPKRQPTDGDAARDEREPWRAGYSAREYREARQLTIKRTRGRCADCGRQCAWWDGSRWLTAGMDGEVDHVVTLCEGGTSDAENLQLRCKSCHKKRDDARRAQHKG